MYLKITTLASTHVFEANQISYKTDEVTYEELGKLHNLQTYKTLSMDEVKIDNSPTIMMFFDLKDPEQYYVLEKFCIKSAYIMNENGKTIDTPVKN